MHARSEVNIQGPHRHFIGLQLIVKQSVKARVGAGNVDAASTSRTRPRILLKSEPPEMYSMDLSYTATTVEPTNGAGRESLGPHPHPEG